jgi:hypothetical protein
MRLEPLVASLRTPPAFTFVESRANVSGGHISRLKTAMTDAIFPVIDIALLFLVDQNL